MLSVASTRTCPLCTTGPKSSAIITAPGEKCGLVGDAGLVAPILTKTRDSFNLDAIAQVLGAAAFADLAYAQRTWSAIRAERRRLSKALRELGFRVPDSETNFVLAQAIGCSSARAVLARLRERGIVVRHFDTPRLANSLRIPSHRRHGGRKQCPVGGIEGGRLQVKGWRVGAAPGVRQDCYYSSPSQRARTSRYDRTTARLESRGCSRSSPGHLGTRPGNRNLVRRGHQDAHHRPSSVNGGQLRAFEEFFASWR